MLDKQNNNKGSFRRVVQSLSANTAADILRYGWGKEDVISLAQGEGCAPTPDFISDATYQALKEGKTHYGPVLGQPALRQEISDYYKRVFELDVPSNRVFMTSSGTTAMHLGLTSILDTDDEVVAITPIWKNLLGAVEVAEAHTVQVPLTYDDANSAWNLDLEAVMSACTSKTKAILVVTPSNPTGWVMGTEQMKELLDFARERNIWIVSDEVYNRAVYGEVRAPSFLDVAKEDDLLMVINSFSKAWAMTGWRLGWLVGPPCAEEVIRDIALYDNMGPPTFTQFGGIKALQDGEAFIQEQMDLWQSNIDLLMKRLGTNPRVKIANPKSTFYAFFKVDGEEDCLAFTKRLIDEGGISLTPGCAFGNDCKGWVRLCFAVSEEKLNKAIDRIEKVIGVGEA